MDAMLLVWFGGHLLQLEMEANPGNLYQAKVNKLFFCTPCAIPGKLLFIPARILLDVTILLTYLITYYLLNYLLISYLLIYLLITYLLIAYLFLTYYFLLT
jgi:hypothetical protein